MNFANRLGSAVGRARRRSATAMLEGEEGYARERARGLDETATASRGRYLERLDAFNPMDYVRDASGAAFADISEDFDDSESQRRAAINRSGFYSDVGGGEARAGFQARLARAIAGLSMQGAQMHQGAIDRYGQLYGSDRGYASDATDQHLDLLTSRADREIAAQEAKRTRKASRWGALGKLAGGVAGAVLGPVGAAAGSALAGRFFGKE